MTRRRISKINWPYLLACVMAPLALLLVAVRQCWKLPEDWDAAQLLQLRPGMAALIPVVVLALCALWWTKGVRAVFHACLDGVERNLERKGFRCGRSFTDRGCAVFMDEEAGRIALLFKWNPFQPCKFPARRITRVWVEDGRRGRGVMEGTRRVSFLFTVGGSTVRVNTFSSNQRWKMDSDNVLTAISMADMMADILESLRRGEG